MIPPLTMSQLSSHIKRKGELRMFDNGRILHSCTGFDALASRRCLQGRYIDIDEPCSRYRMFSRPLQAISVPEAT